jgi:hypothetical protein
MALFGKTEARAADDAKRKETLDALEEATRRLAVVGAEIEGKIETLDTLDERNELKKEVADLQVSKSKIEEEHAREKREIEN